MNEQITHYANKLAYEIDASDLHALLVANGNVLVIDARTPEAFAHEHIPGARNVPHRTMDADSTADIARDTLVVCYCDGIGCNASTKGALAMARLGFTVKELMGGLDWWKRDGYASAGIAGTQGDREIVCGC